MVSTLRWLLTAALLTAPVGVAVGESRTASADAVPLAAGAAAAPGGLRFTSFVIAAAPAGTVCPGGDACWNRSVEPQIRADAAGAFYLASENGLFRGTIAAKSTDGGLHYTSLPSPNALSGGNEPGFAPAGGDTDVAVAPVANAAGFFNVYVASLSLADVNVSTSTNGGAAWKLNPTAAQVAGDDREWIAADGARKVCISYHDLATFNVDVDCSYDAGTTFLQHARPGAIDAAHAFLLQNNQIGNLAIDPSSHTMYQVIAGIAHAGEAVCGFAFTCRYHAVWMAVSTDGGRTFTDYPVYVAPSDKVGLNHQFPNVTVDRAGNVYALWSDDHDVSYAVSTDRGRTWSKPVQVNKPPVRTAIFPWAVAGDAGKLDVVYYGTSYYDGVVPPDNYPQSAAWYAYFAQNLDALSPRSDFTQVRATPVVHYGAVCESGIGCSGNRDLYDDFGVAASPTTGLASIVYDDDQYDPKTAAPGCTEARSNTPACVHTAVATQTGGRGIFGKG
ncbi:MAG TPA: sialidase family protein [Gaiellaceae bacterium]|jgi:hypothetical protein